MQLTKEKAGIGGMLMDKKRIERLRALINKMLSSENYDYDKLLIKSQELDKLLVEAMKESMCVDEVFKEEQKKLN